MSSVHISLDVADLEKSAQFYGRFFGDPVKRKPAYAKFVTADPEIHLALQPAAGPVGPGHGVLSHVGIRVSSVEEVLGWKKRLEERGLSPETETLEACCYALQQKVWLTDPDGNRWEIYTVLEDLEEEAVDDAARARCCPDKSRAELRGTGAA